jgi:hypothetical protein
MWRGLSSSIAGKAANNHFYYLGVWISYTIPGAAQNGVVCTYTGNLSYQSPAIFNRKNHTVSMHLMIGSVKMSSQKKCQCPTRLYQELHSFSPLALLATK